MVIRKPFYLIAIALVFTLLLSSLTGCIFAAKEKTFEKAGMTITLTSLFVEKNVASSAAYYESRSSIVSVIKEEFYLFEQLGYVIENLTLDDYAELVIENNHLNASIEKRDGLVSFTFQKQANGKDFSYFAVVFKSSDAFWLFQFGCETKNFDTSLSQFIKWAKTVIV